MDKIKIFIYAAVLLFAVDFSSSYIKLNKQCENAIANLKAFTAENNVLKQENLKYQFSLEQLAYINDSIGNEMNKVRKELKIKDDKIKAMQYIKSEVYIRDTIVFRDTLFKDTVQCVDTNITNDWYSLALHLEYPSTIDVSPEIHSEQYVMFSNRKETVNVPKKTWIGRLFQKKHNVVEVNIVEKNPYIEIKKSKFIEIIK